jgi:hypothetical protein
MLYLVAIDRHDLLTFARLNTGNIDEFVKD